MPARTDAGCVGASAVGPRCSTRRGRHHSLSFRVVEPVVVGRAGVPSCGAIAEGGLRTQLNASENEPPGGPEQEGFHARPATPRRKRDAVELTIPAVNTGRIRVDSRPKL